MIIVKKEKRFSIILREALNVLTFRKSYPRILTDSVLKQVMPQLKKSLIDLGSSKKTKKFYEKYNPEIEYISTNISGDYDKYLDMENTKMPDDSADNFLSVYSIEHLKNPQIACDEIYRVLKKDGFFILVAPFMVRRHCLPDYYRFSYDSLVHLLRKFSEIKIYRVGDFDTQFIHYFYPRIKLWPFLLLLLIYKFFKSLIIQDWEFEESIGKAGEGFSAAHPFSYLVIAKK